LRTTYVAEKDRGLAAKDWAAAKDEEGLKDEALPESIEI
jgi:hypothetical protein